MTRNGVALINKTRGDEKRPSRTTCSGRRLNRRTTLATSQYPRRRTFKNRWVSPEAVWGPGQLMAQRWLCPLGQPPNPV